MCMCWDLIGMRRPDWRQLAATGGQLCFLYQWRRAGFCLLPAWPDAILLDDVRAVTQRTTDQLAARAPTVDVVVHLAGSPCPGLCAWNPFRHGEQEISFPLAAVEEMEVYFASMSNECRDVMSKQAGYSPVEIQVADPVEQRRRRYFWCSWKVRARTGVVLEEQPGVTRVRLRPHARLATSAWIQPGWRTARDHVSFPTLMHPCPVRTPRWRMPGVDEASQFALDQWRRNRHRRPPVHYERKVMLVHEKTGKRRYKDTGENEVLHGFERGHTLPAYTSKERRLDPVGAVDARGRLLGNCYHPFAVAFLVGELAAELELVREGVDIDELAQARIRLVPTANASVLSNADQRADGHPHELGLQDMARYLLLQQSARGGEIRNLAGVPHRACKWSEVPAQWFQWSTALSVPWRQRAHINICEAMARHLSLRQRGRQASLHHQRFLHLLESQVCLNAASKGAGTRAEEVQWCAARVQPAGRQRQEFRHLAGDGDISEANEVFSRHGLSSFATSLWANPKEWAREGVALCRASGKLSSKS